MPVLIQMEFDQGCASGKSSEASLLSATNVGAFLPLSPSAQGRPWRAVPVRWVDLRTSASEKADSHVL